MDMVRARWDTVLAEYRHPSFASCIRVVLWAVKRRGSLCIVKMICV